ncbi:hypothetical protein [Neotabrizicola sp. sgz301269]|uniref:hypothetical protein n=1 Tax=Neotabrizicola sp. sgz301269 TaxID=3276282 RepID=UPI00376F60AD
MTKKIRSLISGFRIPSLSTVISDIEGLYVNAAEGAEERARRQREVAAGRFRNW